MIVVVEEFFFLFCPRQYINVVVVTGNGLYYLPSITLHYLLRDTAVAYCNSLFLFQFERMHVGLNIDSASVSFSCLRWCSSTSSSILSRRICVYSRNTWPHTMFNYNRSNKGGGRQTLIRTTHHIVSIDF